MARCICRIATRPAVTCATSRCGRASREDYDLIVRDDDRDEDIFVLVIGKAPTYRVVSWVRGTDAKRPSWQRTNGNRPAAFFVPQAILESPERLRSLRQCAAR